MFENEKNTVDTLLSEDDGFRRLFDKHATLNAQVDEASTGRLSIAALELESLKRQKLQLADQMQAMIHAYRHA